jgi:hypothetical protein
MGRHSTGALTTKEIKRIELSYLLKNGYIVKGKHIASSLSWTCGSSAGFESKYFENEAYIRLNYTNTKYSTNEVTKHDYKIQLVTIPSNLGKGNLLYMLCPVTNKRCRILYCAYDSTIWKSREAYKNRIYYQDQLDPKSVRPYKYLFTDRIMDELYSKKKKSHYRGKPTRIMKRIEKLNQKHDLAFLDYDKFERLLCGIK